MVITNMRVFYSIAQQAFDEMKGYLRENIRLKSNGELGYIKTVDFEQKSFKNAMICIVFSGIYLESILHIIISKKYGNKEAKKLDHTTYEKKLGRIGCENEEILKRVKRFRRVRKLIVHEKAMILKSDIIIAQDEAEETMNLIEDIRTYLKLEKI